jgi:hypothetical protein
MSQLFVETETKNKQTHSGKNKSTRSYETCHSLQASRRGHTWRKMTNLKTSKRELFETLLKEVGEFFVSGGSANTLMKTRKCTRGADTAY